MSNDGKVGIIHEIGDMGLGFTELSKQEQQQLHEGKSEEERPKAEGSRG